MNDEISEITRLLPPPAMPDLNPERARALRAHLVAEVAGARPGPAPARSQGSQRAQRAQRSRRPGWLVAGVTGAVAAGAAATVAVSVLVSGGGPSAGASPAAVTLLAKIATAAARQPAPKVSDSEFVYVRSQVSFRVDSIVNGHDTVTMDSPHERQVWLPVASTCGGLLIEHGQRSSLGSSAVAYESTGNGPAHRVTPQCAGSVNDPTYRFLQSLPTDPRKLLDFIYDKTRGEGQAQGRDGEAFITIGDLIRESIVPPQTAAALYRAAALIPGVTVVAHATNALGRPGVAVAWTGGQSGDAYEWIFDAKTYQFIGEQDTSGKTAIVRQAFVAKAGQLPKR